MKKKGTLITFTLLVLFSMLSNEFFIHAVGYLDQEALRENKTLYPGVTQTHVSTYSTSEYGLQDLHIVEFNPLQKDLYCDVVMCGDYSNELDYVTESVNKFNQNNTDNKQAISAVNGDLYMTAVHSGKDVTKEVLSIPRGFSMSNGEILNSPQISQEDPYQEEFWSFGFTDDNEPLLGCPQVNINVTNKTTNAITTADGLNRLPANDALILYSDKGCLNNYALDDAYEVVIDSSYDYIINHGAKINGKITEIYKSGSTTRPTMQPNRLILTARGENKISRINEYNIGDEIEISVEVYEKYDKNSSQWKIVKNAIGGHIPIIVEGNLTDEFENQNVRIPSTIIGINNDNNVLLIANDGRQKHSQGIFISDYGKLAKDYDLYSAFIVDGGGSVTMVNETGKNNYKVVNSPSDGHPRKVANCVILSRAPARNNFHGWSQENNYWRYYASNGLSHTNWLWDDEYIGWYYLDQNGYMQTGWLEDDKLWYYLDTSGKMQTNWKNNIPGWGDKWFYFDINTGEMKIGWHWDNELQSWYYLKQDGTMACNEWIWDNSYQGYYYFGSNGKMYVNSFTPDGYFVDNSGKYVLN